MGRCILFSMVFMSNKMVFGIPNSRMRQSCDKTPAINALVFSSAPGEIRRVKPLPFLTLLAFCCFPLGFTRAADARQDFLKLIDRPRVALDAKVEELPETNGLKMFHFSFATESGQRIPGILLKSAKVQGRQPVVIALHGTGGSKNDMLPACRQLAERGFIAVAIDGRYHGERSPTKGAYEAAILHAWHEPGEHPFFYDTVWDVMRLIDYLQTREDVDPARIGLTGISKGGIETYLTAAVDPRVTASVPCIGVESFRWALDHNDWKGRVGTIQKTFDAIVKESGATNIDTAMVQKFYDRVTPGIYGEFDGPAMVALIAPRPLLVINSDSDTHTPLPGVNECIESARRAYHEAAAEDHLKVIIQEHTGHKVNPDSERAEIEWFVKWLKPAPVN
jgi:dienelactone hydrolase